MALSDKLESARKKLQRKKKRRKKRKQRKQSVKLGEKRARRRRVKRNNPKGVTEGALATARQARLLANEVGVSRENAAKVSSALPSSTELTDSSGKDTDDILSNLNDGLGAGGLDEGSLDDGPVDATVDFGGGTLGSGGDFETGQPLGRGVSFGPVDGGADDLGAGVSFNDDL